MTLEGSRALAIAVRNNRVGYVLIIDGEPAQWAKSRRACRGAKQAARFLDYWMRRFSPEKIVIEDPQTARRKGRKTKAVIRSLTLTAERSGATLLIAHRRNNHPSLYREACAYVERFPAMTAVSASERRTWTSEDPNYVYFEALALAEAAGLIGKQV